VTSPSSLIDVTPMCTSVYAAGKKGIPPGHLNATQNLKLPRPSMSGSCEMRRMVAAPSAMRWLSSEVQWEWIPSEALMRRLFCWWYWWSTLPYITKHSEKVNGYYTLQILLTSITMPPKRTSNCSRRKAP